MNDLTAHTLNGADQPDFDTMTAQQFEQYLPDLFAAGSPSISSDPRLQKFLARNPDCAALVRDLEAIATAAMNLFPVQEPSDALWSKIEKEMASSSTKRSTDTIDID